MSGEAGPQAAADYTCATCGRRVEYEGPLPARFPFCSPRCQMVDLGRWLREDYTIERELTPDERVGVREDTTERPEPAE